MDELRLAIARYGQPFAAVLLLAFVTACAPTHVESDYSRSASALPAPRVIAVEDFAPPQGGIALDRGITARLGRVLGGGSGDAQQQAAAQQVVSAVAEALVHELGAKGFAALRAGPSYPATTESTLIVSGQILSIDEGNRTRRNLVGFGAGHSDVTAQVQVHLAEPGGGRLLVSTFNADAQSGRKPGAVTTAGAGVAADRVAQAAAAQAGASVVSETRGATVEADASRMGKEIAKKIAELFTRQGWPVGAPH